MAALLIIPGVTARFWSDRLGHVVLFAAGIGVAMGLVGTFLSATYNKMPAGPVITLVGTALFITSALAAPQRGLIARAWVRVRDRWQTEYDEVLRRLYEAEEADRPRGFDDIHKGKAWARDRVRKLLDAMVRAGDAAFDLSRGYVLTATGNARAVEVVRRHRLWKLLIDEYPDLVPVARPMSREPVEEFVPSEIVADLEAKLRANGRWPETRTAHLAEGVR
jgi:manganese/zinc/iron transport system permease protein